MLSVFTLVSSSCLAWSAQVWGWGIAWLIYTDVSAGLKKGGGRGHFQMGDQEGFLEEAEFD